MEKIKDNSVRFWYIAQIIQNGWSRDTLGLMIFSNTRPTDQATIGLILCQTKDRILAEYALCDINKPIGISEYELTRALPENLKSSLPSIEELEAELGGIHQEDSGDE